MKIDPPSLEINGCKINSTSKSSNETTPQLDYDHFINSFTKKVKPSGLRTLGNLFESLPEGKVNLVNGRPNEVTFPFQNIKATLKDGSSIILEGNTLNKALQYGAGRGDPNLCNWLMQFQDKIHGPLSWEKYSLFMSAGCQESLSAMVSTVLEPHDAIIIQTPTYPGILSLLKPNDIEMIPLHTKLEGVQTEELKQLLEERSASGVTMPRLLMVNPVGGNPSGVSISTKDKEEIYKLACKYNLLIVEDDPYYFLNFSETEQKSFLSMDSECRVVRFDSFSKVVSPGLRLGYITGPYKIVEKMQSNIGLSSMHSSRVSQMFVYELLKQWQFAGFTQHMNEVRMFYKRKRDIMVRAVEEHLKDLVEYTIPTAGFFFWMRLKFIEDTKKLAQENCLKYLLLVAPGCIFYGDDKKKSSYLRISYSLLSDDEINDVISTLAMVINEEVSKMKRNS